MRETLKSPSFASIQCWAAVLLLSIAAVVAWISTSGCSVKKSIKVPQGIWQAKTANFEELLAIIRSYDKINSLSCNEVDLTFISSRKKEKGILERFKKVRAHILLKRPDSVHLVIRIPLIQSTLFDVVSVGDDFSVWMPRENKLYEGKNSARELIAEGSSDAKDFTVPIRGPHIFEAIFPQSIVLDAPGTKFDVEPQTDAHTSYYVLSVLKVDESPRVRTMRKIWIDRSGLTIAREQVFGEDQVVSDIAYSNEVQKEGFSLPLQIHIDRPVDKYTLDLRFTSWNINPDLPDDAFKFPILPPDAQIVHLKEK